MRFIFMFVTAVWCYFLLSYNGQRKRVFTIIMIVILGKIPGNIGITEIQIVLLGTAHISLGGLYPSTKPADL